MKWKILFSVFIFSCFATTNTTLYGGSHEVVTQRSPDPSLCWLPPYPDHGTYEVTNLTNTNGQSASTFVLSVACDKGYGLVGTKGDVGGGRAEVLCFYGEWSHSMPWCERYCRLDPNPSVRYECQEPGTSWFKPCPLLVSPGTLVNPVCNSPIYYSHHSLLYMKCSHGSWNYIAQCTAECGRITPAGEQLVLGGTKAKRGEIPWHVGIFDKLFDPYKLICGGSIVSNNIVISAAHCFWDDRLKQLPASNFVVATGKLYNSYDNKDDVDAQKSEVKEIRIPKLFLGMENNLQSDIAVLILATPFEYKTYVRPVCLNFDKNFDKRQLQHGKLGKIAGWGLIAANGAPSPVLKVVDLPYIDWNTCINTVRPSFKEFITWDKFCAGYTNGTAVCEGDSGGGLSFADNELGVERYYLRGVVSASPNDDYNLCNAFTYSTFTSIAVHDEFIKESVATSMGKICSSFQYQCANGMCVDQTAVCNATQECADGSDESEQLCKASPDVEHTTSSPPSALGPCVYPPYPEHGTYEVVHVPNARPGQSADSFVLTVSCSQGYGLFNSRDGTQTIVCENGTWKQNVPTCVNDPRFCRLNPNPGVRYACFGGDKYIYKDCKSNLLAPGTEVQPICNRDYYSPALPRIMECVSGEWRNVHKCRAECGRVFPQEEFLNIPTKHARLGDVPWNVAIYKKDDLICSGSIVSNYFIITAAVCFGDAVYVPDYLVATNKLYWNLNDVRDFDSQQSRIQEIKIAYSTDKQNIALVVLVTPLVFNSYVRPVCFNTDFVSDKILKEGDMGKMSGWIPGHNVGSVNRLQLLDIAFLEPETCNSVPEIAAKANKTEGLFCTGHNEALPGLRENRGSGLVFAHNESGVIRYFLRGVLSHPEPCTRCETVLKDYYAVAFFINVTKYEDYVNLYI